MAEPSIKMSKPGGLYRTVQALQWVLRDDVERFSFTINGVQPTMSKYIAYDTLPGKNPFIAVTQDGAGNVVYDGGFPKFYNKYAPAASATKFSQLSASFKYLYNALNFCANKKKTDIGNRKVLVLGNGGSNGNTYRIFGTGASDFYTSLSRLMKVAGYNMVLHDSTQYASKKIDCTLTELDQYCCVIMFSSRAFINYTNPIITPQAVTDLVTYRERGNGLIIITDHGLSTEANDKIGKSSHYITTANQLVLNFGAYFTGNFDRSPVNVGYLRRTYGDHALYTGMADSESIWAGPSESKVVVTKYPEYTRETAPTVNLTQDGKYVISILAIMKDGTAETLRYVFNIVLGEFLWWKHNDGHILGDTYTTKLATSDFLPSITSNDNGTLTGNVTRNGKKLGSFVHDSNTVKTTYKWLSGSNVFPVNDKDVFNIEVVEPFSYNKSLTVTRYQPPVSAIIDHANMLKLLNTDDYANIPRKNLVNSIIKEIAPLFPEYPLTLNGNAARDIAIIRKFTGEFVGETTQAYIYATSDDAKEGRRVLTTEPNCIIDAEKNEVWEYMYPEWVKIEGLKAQDFLGAPRRVESISNGDLFLLRNDGTIVQV